MQFAPYSFTRVFSVLNMCIILPLVIYYFKYFGKILPVLSTSINEFKMKKMFLIEHGLIPSSYSVDKRQNTTR